MPTSSLPLPAFPAVGQLYTNGGKTWFWNGSAWKLQTTGGTGVVATTALSSNPPTVTESGMLWYDTTDSTLYIRVGTTWIEATGAVTGYMGSAGANGTSVNANKTVGYALVFGG